MEFVQRPGWGARPPKADNRHSHPLTKVAVHWIGPGAGWPWPHTECAGRVRGIQSYHQDGNGWNDIAYNFLVCPHGVIFEGRGLGAANAANGGVDGDGSGHGDNHEYIAICYLGGEGDEFTPEARDAINDAADLAGLGDAPWAGHRDLTDTSCPGGEIYEWVRAGHPRAGGTPARPSDPWADLFVPVLAS